MAIYCIRHGQSEFNAVFERGGDDPLVFDAPLSPRGREQARGIRDQVASLGIERVVTSPLTRAIETALHIFDGGPPIEVDARARELLTHSCDVGRSPAQLAAQFPVVEFDHLEDIWWHQGPANEHGVAREPVPVFEARVAEFRNWLVAQPDRNMALIGHGNLFKALTGQKLANCEIHLFDETAQFEPGPYA